MSGCGWAFVKIAVTTAAVIVVAVDAWKEWNRSFDDKGGWMKNEYADPYVDRCLVCGPQEFPTGGTLKTACLPALTAHQSLMKRLPRKQPPITNCLTRTRTTPILEHAVKLLFPKGIPDGDASHVIRYEPKNLSAATNPRCFSILLPGERFSTNFHLTSERVSGCISLQNQRAILFASAEMGVNIL